MSTIRLPIHIRNYRRRSPRREYYKKKYNLSEKQMIRLTEELAMQLDRCADESARRLLLGNRRKR